jgi:ABC-type lipoprotein release transport system permease subunit
MALSQSGRNTSGKGIANFLNSLKLGIFLAIRQVKRSSLGTTLLIIFVMTLTFLNLVVVRGILVGLIQSSINVYRERYIGDVIISTPIKKNYIENSPAIIQVVKNLPWTQSYTARYLTGGLVEGTYKERISYTEKANEATPQFAGINPAMEDEVTHLSDKVIDGRYLTPEDTESIMIGANLLKKYLPIESPGLKTLANVDVGSRVRITVNGNTREMTIKGIIKSKVGELDQRVFMLDSTLRTLTGRTDFNVDEIAIRLKPGADPIVVKNALIQSGAGETGRVQTYDEGLPKFVKDMRDTFALLGDVIGSIGLVVASITIFIVIYINAITRRKFIGILKGIGIDAVAIEFSYILQSIFYALMGVLIGFLILYGMLVPYFNAHPINFPFSDGILVAELSGTIIRGGLLLIATIIAGYIPARLVVKQNTLDAILGR